MRYDVLLAVRNAQSGLIFGHLLQVEAAYAQKELRFIFERRKLKLRMVAVRRGESGEDLDQCLAVSVGHSNGHIFRILPTTDAVPNVLSSCVMQKLSLSPDWTRRAVMVAMAARSGAVEKLAMILVMLDDR